LDKRCSFSINWWWWWSEFCRIKNW